MPTADPGHSGLRIGGWIPKHTFPEGDKPRPGPDVQHRPVPAPRPIDTPRIRLRTTEPYATWFLIVIGLVAIVAVSAAFVITRSWRDDRPRTVGAAALPRITVPDPPTPVPVLPAPPWPAPTTAAPATTDSSSSAHPPPARSPGRRPDLVWTVGRTVSLEPEQWPGYRVRHRDFRARIDRLDASSRPLDRADATFTVRSGLADSRCVSLESTNYPGRFLRHQNFAVLLAVQVGSPLFAADATFCPVEIAPGPARILRSVNYPDHYITVRNAELFLDPTTPAAAAFLLRPGL